MTPRHAMVDLRFCLGAIVLLVGSALHADASRSVADRVDAHIRAEMERHHIPGLAFAVARDGKLVRARAYGFADLEHRVPATPESLFESGSIGKQFTAAAVMLLVEEGKLGLDERASAYLTELPGAWKEITIRHLMTHTSGVPNYNEGEAALALLNTDPPPDKVLALVSGRALLFEPGSKWSYSNTGYFLLGLVLERASGRSYWDFVRERVFAPLRMTSTQRADLARVIPNRVRGYGWNEKENLIENRDSIRPLAAFSSGGFLTNVLDLARWEAAFHGEKLLKRSTLEQMWTPVRLKDGRPGPYGLGFQLDDVQGIPARGHAGGTPGFNGDLRTFGNGSLTIIILANQRNVSELDTLRGEIGGSYLPELLPLHDREPRRDPDPERTRLLRTVLTDWAAEDKDSPRIVPGLQALHSSAMSAMTRGRLEKIEAFEFLGERETGDAVIERLGSRVRRIVLYRMRSGGEWFYYTFYLTEDGRVAYFQSSTR